MKLTLEELKANIHSPSKFATGVIELLNAKAAVTIDARRSTMQSPEATPTTNSKEEK